MLPPFAPPAKRVSRAHVQKTLEFFFGPTVRLQRVTAAGVEGCRVVYRRDGEELIAAQTFERDVHGLEAHAGLVAIQGLKKSR